MKYAIQKSKILLSVGLFVIVIGTTSWQPKAGRKQNIQNYEAGGTDTARPRSYSTEQTDLSVNLDSALQAAQAALSAIDFSKLQQQINTSVASINFDDIGKSINAAMKSIDWDKMKLDVNNALEDARAEIAKVNTSELKASLEKAREELKSQQLQQRINIGDLQKQLAQSMAQAKKQMEKARLEFANYKSFISALQQDGLIKANEAYKVELKNNVLYINGVKQTKETTEKYRKFYEGKTNFSIYDDRNNKDKDGDDGTDL